MVGKSAFVYLMLALAAASIYAGWMRGYEIGALSLGYSVRQTPDGGYIIGGATLASDTSYSDLLLIKTDSLGDTMWTRIYGGGGSDVATCVQQTKDDGYIVTGHLGPVLWLLKTDSEGDTVWTRTYGSWCSGNWVEQTSDGGYIVTGNYEDAYLWLFKTDEDGYMMWQDTLNEGPNEIGNCIQETQDGGYIVTGEWGAYLLLLKTNADGDTLWMRTDCPGDRGYCVKETKDGGYIVAGYRGSTYSDIRLLRFNSDGDTIWTRTYGGGGDDEAYEVQQTGDSGYVIFGNSGSFGGGWILKTDSDGDTFWTRIFGGSRFDEVFSGQQTTDGGYVMTGWTNLFSDDWTSDVWLVKTDSLGYAEVEEPPVTHQPDCEIVSSVGQTIILRYENHPQGFRATIYDAIGRKVDELSSTSQSGTITWGESWNPGVYFLKEGKSTTRVVIVR